MFEVGKFYQFEIWDPDDRDHGGTIGGFVASVTEVALPLIHTRGSKFEHYKVRILNTSSIAFVSATSANDPDEITGSDNDF